MMMNRRNFFHASGLVAYAVAMSGTFESLKVFFKKARRREEPIQRENPYVRDGKSLVVITGGRDIKQMVSESVSLLGGFGKVGIKHRTVLVKPNLVGGAKKPTTTNPDVVKAVVSILYEEGASSVIVGDMSALIRHSTKKNMEKTGIKKAAEEAGARIVQFDDHGWVKVKIPEGKYIKEVDVSEWIFKVDRIVNLPVIKTHRYAGYSICLKNFVGATHFKQRPYFVDRSHWEEVVSEINLVYSPDLNIADGTRIMVSGGPWEGAVEEANIVIAGGDRVAVDATGLAVIKSYDGSISGRVWDQRQIKHAAEMGIGIKGGDEMEILTSSLDGDPGFKKLVQSINRNIV